MDRRSFLQLMFSLGAAKVAAKVLSPKKRKYDAQTVIDAFNSPTYTDGPLYRPWTYIKEFELTAHSPTESLSIVERDTPFELQRFGLCLDYECPYEAAQQFFNEVFLKMAVGSNELFSIPASLSMIGLPLYSGLPSFPSLPLYPNLRLSNEGLQVSLEAAQKWVPPGGIKGQIVMHGVKVYKSW